MYKIQSLLKGAALSAALLMGSQSAVAEEWKFAIEEIPGSIMDAYAQEFKKRIEQKTNGDITVKIYPLGSWVHPPS